MNAWAFPSFFSAGMSLVLAVILFWKRNDSPLFSPLILVMGVVTWIQGLNGISAVFQGNPILWKQLILLGELTLPVVVGYASHSLLKSYFVDLGVPGSGWWRVMGAGVAILGALVLVFPDAFMRVHQGGEIVFEKPEGLTVWIFIVVASFIVLFRLEQILRSLGDPIRYRLKYVLVGLGGLICISLAQAIHMFVNPIWKQDFDWAGGIAALSSLALIGVGLGRWRVKHLSQKFQISHQALYTSLTVLFVGGYVVFVGIVAAVIQQTGWEVKESLRAVLVFLAALGLLVVMLSRHTRAEFQQFVSRHFFRSKYDYREKWLEVTETFTACNDIQQVWNRYLEWLSRTFVGSRVTIWKYFDVDGRYHQIRKERRRRKWVEKDRLPVIQEPAPIPEAHPIILQMKEQKGPVFIKEGKRPVDGWEAFLHVTHAHVCVPLLTGKGRLLGFCTLSKELPDEGYDQDDFDLLRAIAHHVTMLLLQFQLQEERSSSAKWEAVHRFSGFYMHDLKNLASSLSMVAQNADQYGSQPEFQASAIRTVRNISQRIVDLMGELANQAKGPNLSEGCPTQAVSLNTLIKETLAGVTGPGCIPNFSPGQEVPLLHLKVESMKQVLLNLILNARQATGEDGAINITTACDGEQVIVEIVDTGDGMSEAQLENLFQPFKSSKKNGLGVGLFQCKRIVEDHEGMIHIESQEGLGTTVILTFPVKHADNSGTTMSGMSNARVGNDSTRNG